MADLLASEELERLGLEVTLVDTDDLDRMLRFAELVREHLHLGHRRPEGGAFRAVTNGPRNFCC